MLCWHRIGRARERDLAVQGDYEATSVLIRLRCGGREVVFTGTRGARGGGGWWRCNDETTGTRSEESEAVVVVALLSSTYYIRDSMPNAGIPKK